MDEEAVEVGFCDGGVGEERAAKGSTEDDVE